MYRKLCAAGVISALAVPLLISTASAAPPGAPILNADVNSDETIDLVSTKPAGATGFRIYNGTTGAQIATDTDNWYRTAVQSGTVKFQTAAVNSAGEISAKSNIVTLTAPYPLEVSATTLTAPAAGSTVSGVIETNATWDTTKPISEMRYRVDGQVVDVDAAVDNADGAKGSFDTKTLPNGSHYLQAESVRASNGAVQTTSPKLININNATTPTPPPATNLDDPVVKEKALQITSTAENSTVNWWEQYDYIEDIGDGRGYTAGIVGFTSGTSDMLKLVENYTTATPTNGLSKFIDELRQIDAAPYDQRPALSHSLLDPQNFTAAWAAEAAKPEFQKAQDAERDRVYWAPALAAAKADGVGPLGLWLLYDISVNHGPGTDSESFGGIVAAARTQSPPPSQGGNEASYLRALDEKRTAVLTSWGDNQPNGRDEATRQLIDAGEFALAVPVTWSMYGTSFTMSTDPTPRSGGGTTPPPAPAPTVTLTKPTAGATVSGNAVELNVTAANATLVEYFAGTVKIGEDGDGTNTDGWQATWDTTTVANGGHQITAKATGPNGVTTSAPVTVTVSNTATPPPATTEPTLPTGSTVPAKGETAPFSSGSGDIADDPAIWVHPTDPAQSLVIGSKKAASGGGLYGYNLNGTQAWSVAAGEVNNVDIRVISGKTVVVASERGTNVLKFWYLNSSTRTLTAAGSLAAGFEPYGACLGIVGGTQLTVFATNRNSPYDFDQWNLTAGSSTVTGTKVRNLTTSTLSESCVVDDAAGNVYLSQETSGVRRYAATSTGGSTNTMIAPVGSNGVTADVEGLAIAYPRTSGGPKYLLVSSQGASSYQVFDITGSTAFKRSFTIPSGTVDGVTGTDGLEATRENLGSLYPNGLVVVHDATNTSQATSNFKLVDAGLVFGAYGSGGTAPAPTTEPTPTPTPAPAPVAARGPVGSTVIYSDNFETGLDCTIWARVQNQVTSNSGTPTDCANWDPDGDGSRLSFPQDGGDQGVDDRRARFELRNGDVSAPGNNGGTGHRTQITGDSEPWQFREGDERWVQLRVRKDTEIRDTILMQFHAGLSSPPLEIGIDGADLTLDSHSTGTCPDSAVLATAAEWPVGKWIDINLHVKWSQSASTGFVEVYVNGVKKLDKISCKTMETGSSRIYQTFGMYRGSDTAGTYVASFDDLALTRN